jgi:hypothetical protein
MFQVEGPCEEEWGNVAQFCVDQEELIKFGFNSSCSCIWYTTIVHLIGQQQNVN